VLADDTKKAKVLAKVILDARERVSERPVGAGG
jgi:hypothetical protein